MKQTFIIIVQNTNEAFTLGDYNGLFEAEKDVDQIEHCDHGHGSILIEKQYIPKLIERLEKLK